MTFTGMDSLMNELLGALDEQIELLQVKSAQLDGLFRALVDRDEEATETVLERMEQAQETQVSADGRLAGVRASLADTLGREEGDLRLSALIRELPGPWGQAVEDRRRQILDLTDTLRGEHLRTVMLLQECIRLNRVLLESLVPRGQAVETYGAKGHRLWRPQAGLMDTES